MIRTFLAGLLLWLASRLIPKPTVRRVEPLVKWTRNARADETYSREVLLYRLRIADGYLGIALGWKRTEVRQ